MRTCPHCGLGVVEEDAVCPYCGHDMPTLVAPPAPVVESSAPLVAPAAPVVAPAAPARSDAQPPASDRQDAQPPVADRPDVQPAVADRQDLQPAVANRQATAPAPIPPAAGTTASNRGLLAVAAVAAVVIGAVVLMQLFRGSDTRQEPSPAVAPAASTGGGAPRPSASSAPALPRPAPKPSGNAAQPRWTRSDSRIVEYELPAVREVPVWMTRVRPILVVRCASRETDVLVLMHSAASFESQAGKHTVRIGFDEGTETNEQWIESNDAQALFAPDGVALARRIAASRAMRFGFTPHNASPVVVDFDVRGFDALIGSVAKACRWKP